jgi:ADP-ribose pyrophosphatase YjhB (NUDIX family)
MHLILRGMAEAQLFYLGVKALVRNDHNEVLMLRIRRSATEDYYDLPGGRVNEGEAPEAALTREIFEETGLTGMTIGRHVALAPFGAHIPSSEGRQVGLIFSIYACTIPDMSAFVMEPGMEVTWQAAREVVPLLEHCSVELAQALTNELGV